MVSFFGIVDKIRILSMSQWCHIFSTAVLYLFTYPCNTLFTLSYRDPIVFQLFFYRRENTDNLTETFHSQIHLMIARGLITFTSMIFD